MRSCFSLSVHGSKCHLAVPFCRISHCFPDRQRIVGNRRPHARIVDRSDNSVPDLVAGLRRRRLSCRRPIACAQNCRGSCGRASNRRILLAAYAPSRSGIYFDRRFAHRFHFPSRSTNGASDIFFGSRLWSSIPGVRRFDGGRSSGFWDTDRARRAEHSGEPADALYWHLGADKHRCVYRVDGRIVHSFAATGVGV